ncbi:tetratricopeptide repeat protein, partial [Amycolatopsis solani]
RPAAATRTVLRALDNAHLLTRTPSGRYRMHDLVRLYASEEAERALPEDVREAALRRVTDFYLRTSWHGHLAIEPLQTPITLEPSLPGVEAQRFGDQAEAVRWFAAEHACLTATTELAAGRGWHTQVWQLAWLLNEFRARQGQLREREAAGRLALAAAEQLGDVTAQLIAYRIHASASIFAGHPEVALECLPGALALAERAGDRLQQAHLHYVMAGAHEYHAQDYRAELAQCERIFELIEPDDAPRLYIRALDLVGFCHLQWSDWPRARHWLDRATAVARKYGDLDGEAHATGNLGFVALRSGDWAEAVEHLERAIGILTTIGNERHAAFFLVALGDSYRLVDREDDARRVLHDALDRYRTHPEGARLKEVEACFLALDEQPVG